MLERDQHAHLPPTNQKAMQKGDQDQGAVPDAGLREAKVCPSMYCDTVMSCPSTLITVCSSVQLAANHAIQRPRSCTRPFPCQCLALEGASYWKAWCRAPQKKGKDISFFMTAFWLYVFH